MKKALKDEIGRRGKAEVELEKVLPILEQHAPEIAEAARKIVFERLQLPDQERNGDRRSSAHHAIKDIKISPLDFESFFAERPTSSLARNFLLQEHAQ